MPRGETSNVADGLENVVAAETVLSKVDGEAGCWSCAAISYRTLPDAAASSGSPDCCGRTSSTAARRGGAAPRPRPGAGTRVRANERPAAGHLPSVAAGSGAHVACRGVPDDAADAPLLLTASVAVGLAAAIRIRDGKPPVAPDPQSTHAADFLRMLKGTPPTPDEAAALNTYLVTRPITD